MYFLNHHFDIFSIRTVLLVVVTLVSVQIVKILLTAIYNLYFHPLCSFPGPKLWIAFPLLRSLAMVRGTLDYEIVELHRTYGPVVRLNATDLSFTSSSAWKDIYGFGHAELKKYFPSFVGFDGQNILSAKGSDHFRFRRAMLPAFTDKSLALQEPLMQVYVDLLITRLGEVADSGKGKNVTNIIKWYNFTTFDLIGDLAYGESFDGLKEGKSNKWLDNIANMLKLMPILALMSVSPTIGRIMQLFAGPTIRNSMAAHLSNASRLAMKRIKREDQVGRGDFMDAMMRARGQGKKHELSDKELVANADILITAGSETTATLLSGVTFWLLRCPESLARVTKEVREQFESGEEIGFKSASERLPFMLACLNEGLRIFPPVPLALMRITNPGPNTEIAGYSVPPGTKVGIHQLSTYHFPTNFHLPHEFHPERWLPSSINDPTSPFYNDNRESHKPFSFGPRDCIGRNLAYHEMRIILAKVLWHFDLGWGDEGGAKVVGEEGAIGWERQKVFGIWEKPPLMVKVSRRKDL